MAEKPVRSSERKHGVDVKRFWSKTVRQGDGCIVWTACKKDGYGVFYRGPGLGTILAHRMVYIWQHGELTSDDIVMHSCDNPACVNINHLSKGTHADNVADKVAKGRGISGQRHYRAKLTDDQIREIRASDMNQYELAKLYGVSQPTVSEIQNRKVWAHIQ